MRLIDADRALEIVRDQGIAHPNAHHLTNYATLILREAPTIDAVPVVRCRECKKHGLSVFYPDRLFCLEHRRYVDPDGYCYLGERKEGGD